ncbi:MAG: tetraacyldisaccharide 4'-kinase [Bryobacteraceae bacterium]
MNGSSALKSGFRLNTPNVILEITKRTIGLTRTLLLYRSIQLLASPFVISYFIWRIAKRCEYLSGFTERLGLLPQSFSRTTSDSIWLHAVSVGEVASAVPLLRVLRERYPSVPLYLSTSTLAGRTIAERDASTLVRGIFFSPLDFVSCVRRVLRAIRPSLLLILETEIWPNLFTQAKLSGARVVIINGRISDRAWPRYQRWKWLFRPVLRLPDVVAVQSRSDYRRYLELGVPTENLRIEANLKYDTTAASEPLNLDTYGAGHIWVAASTVGPNEKGSLVAHQIDEDDIVLDAFVQLSRDIPDLLLILAPRQPARFDEVAAKLRDRGLDFERRSGKGSQDSRKLPLPGVLLLDTMGELARIYSLADAVFVGGSLAPRGGHNIIEPAAAAAAVVVGPQMQNFASITNDFLEENAVVQIHGSADLVPTIRKLLLDDGFARRIGNRAQNVVQQKAGVSARIVDHLLPAHLLGRSQTPRTPIVRSILSGLAYLWTVGGVLKRRRSDRYASSVPRLPLPVISIGGITVGGSGKTPFTNYLAKQLSVRGWSPAILTRGYRRNASAGELALPAGANVPSSSTGDEAQIFLRSAGVPVGIGPNRYRVGHLVRSEFPDRDVFLLDDGFQHGLVRRDVDIVLIDALDPFGGDEVVPSGRLREPLGALRRAGVFVVTRCDSDILFRSIAERLRKLNANARVFRSRVRTLGWRDVHGQAVGQLPGSRVAAFCGLGNPRTFWNTLESLGLEVALRTTFKDHHRYRPGELDLMLREAQLRSADCLVTTEKDWINLPTGLERLFESPKLFWLEIGFEVENEVEFFSILETQLGRGPIGVHNHRLSGRFKTADS